MLHMLVYFAKKDKSLLNKMLTKVFLSATVDRQMKLLKNMLSKKVT